MSANCNPMDIETAFGDPDALKKAAENMALYPYCIEADLHCIWFDRCRNDPNWTCPLLNDEINAQKNE